MSELTSAAAATAKPGGGLAYRLLLQAAAVVPLPVQRFLRSGPVGNLGRKVLDRVAPAGRYKVLPVRGGLLEGTLLEVDLRKQRDMVAGIYESEVQGALAKHLKRGDTAFDVGAHLGFFTLLMARLAGDEGRVVSVEADPFMGRNLEANLVRNENANVTVVRAAAGKVAVERRFTPGAGGGIGHLADDGEIAVAGTTLDLLAERYGTPQLIKVDVEGGELEVLAGGARLLSDHRPILVVEVHDQQIQDDTVQLLNGFDYDISFIQDDPSRRQHLIAVPSFGVSPSR
ncbi:MAG TPA: FkbM family methyltransferase [Actinomycetota bacterium]|nr:FkbM family methyltransferase [Actinomycetota bacterium]